MNDADWEKPWKREGDWFMREGGGFVLYRVTPITGTFQFTLRPKDAINPFSSPKVRWVLDYRDERNYVLFEMDKRSYSCFEYREGKRNVRVDKKRHGLSGGYYSLKIDVEPNRVVLSVTRDNRSYNVLDEWSRPDRAFTSGRFGFYAPDGAQMWLAHFRFVRPATTR